MSSKKQSASAAAGDEAQREQKAGGTSAGSAPAAPDTAGATGASGAGSGTGNGAGAHDAATDSDVMLDQLREEVGRWKDQAARAQAEFDNARKRLESRHADALKQASSRVIEGLLPSMDDLERAEQHAIESGRSQEAEGIHAIYAKMFSTFEREGVTIIDPLDQPFDHNTAQAVQLVENREVPDQTVVQVLQRGYELNGRVLRPAMVVVATGGEAR